MSLGGSYGNAFRESSSRQNTRRKSLGGALLKAETPNKDRRVLLDEWRRDRHVRGREGVAPDELESSKRIKTQERESPSLPRSASSQSTPSASPAYNEGTTALERIRMRKQQKLQQQSVNNENALPPQHPSSQRSTVCYDEDEENTDDYSRAASSVISGGTPSMSRRLGAGGRARRRSFLPKGPTLSQDDGTLRLTLFYLKKAWLCWLLTLWISSF